MKFQKCGCLSDSVEGEVCTSVTSCSVDPKDDEQEGPDTDDCCPKTGEQKVLNLDAKTEDLSPERIKVRLVGI